MSFLPLLYCKKLLAEEMKFIDNNIMHHMIGEDHYDSHIRGTNASSFNSGTETKQLRVYLSVCRREKKKPGKKRGKKGVV